MSNKDDCISRRGACVLKEFGNCSYSETGCSDCTVKSKIRNALSTQPEQCEWIPKEMGNVPYGLIVECSRCGYSELVDNALYHKYCPNCGRKVIREYE